MDKLKSKLIFNGYKVEKILFEANNEYNGKEVGIELDIDKSIEYKGKEMYVKLVTKLFDKVERDYPFRMSIVIKGFFQIENNEENINFEPNAIAILYPYIRAIVSTYTAAANVTPLILPTINVNAMLRKQKED